MDGKKDLLVVIDMINGFVNFGALADHNINKITPKIIDLIKKANLSGAHIIAFRDAHSIDDEEFNTFPVHCLKGSEESKLIPELAVYKDKMWEIEKDTTNGFVTKDFLELVNKFDFNNVYVVGCCTDICVLNFVNSYLSFNKKYNKTTNIIVIENACATFDSPTHNAKDMHDKAIREMEQNGAKIVRSKENIKE